MRYEVSSKALYNQLLYFRSLWALDKAAVAGKQTGRQGQGKKEGSKREDEDDEDADADEEKVNAVKEWNRERFETCYGVIEGYLKRCGRVWVQMDELFRFALGK